MTPPAGEVPAALDERVLLLVKGRRNAAITTDLLAREEIATTACTSVEDLCAKIREGAAAVVMTEEYLSRRSVRTLQDALRMQPVWSELPFVVFSAGSDRLRLRGLAAILGSVTFLDRPVRTRSMIAAVQAAIRSRRRQYAGRREIESRDTFLAMLGHELRNPLGAISLAVELTSRRGDDKLATRELAIIARQTKHLVRLVDDLLDVARVTRGKLALVRSRVDVGRVARHAYEALAATARERGHTYEIAVPEELWVDGDPERLEQVFSNLLSNAIKYTLPGGTVRIVGRAEEGQVRVLVEDSGMGLAPPMLEKVFEIFTQAERSLDRSQGGLGLGLAVVRTLVELHGGRVYARSDGLGRGSTFVVVLPLLDDPIAAASSRRMPAAPAIGRSAAVIDDNQDLRELLAEILTHAGHRVTTAADGPSGLALILEGKPDVAFVDLGLPGFDGLELARRARAAGSGVTLVAVTGYGQSRDRELALAAGFDLHLTKPVTAADLFVAMQSIADRRA